MVLFVFDNFQIEIQDFLLSFELSTLGSERVNAITIRTCSHKTTTNALIIHKEKNKKSNVDSDLFS